MQRSFEELPEQLLSFIQENARKTNDFKSIIALGETSNVEFKSTLRFNLLANKIDPVIEHASLKTLVAFLNSTGGRLIIGVNDQGEVVGLDNDKFKTPDLFQLHFWNLFRRCIGSEFSEFIKSEIVHVDNKIVFSILCKSSVKPVFLKWKASGDAEFQELFYIRAGPQTERLSTRQIVNYINSHFN